MLSKKETVSFGCNVSHDRLERSNFCRFPRSQVRLGNEGKSPGSAGGGAKRSRTPPPGNGRSPFHLYAESVVPYAYHPRGVGRNPFRVQKMGGSSAAPGLRHADA